MNEHTDHKKYEPFKVPGRQQVQISGSAQPPIEINMLPTTSLPNGVFCEIEYDAISDFGDSKFVLKPEKIEEPAKDEIRDVFNCMRDIARVQRSIYNYSRFFDRRSSHDNSVIFYKQGMFMKDFKDDYAGNAPFSQYFPYYQMMGCEQLRTYFTWRTRVRQGVIADISLSYAFLYIYELLGNIGVANPQDGLDKLVFFWRAFRDHNTSIDKYVLRWLKDYHIYYELPHSFKEFVEANDLADHYPKLAEIDDHFHLFCAISKYNIQKSSFYTDETSKMISDCFAFVMDRIRRDFEIAGMNFDDALFRPTRKLVAWRPFCDSLFYHWIKQRDRQIVLCENEIYMCKNNEWIFSTVITTEKGRQFIGYVMKQMESVLRKITKYRFRLTANIDMIHDDTIRILTKAGLAIEKIVPDAVVEYHREATKTIVTVNYASLVRIREEALITQEALIVEEEAKQKDTAPSPMLFVVQDQNIFADAVANDAGEELASASDIWGNLRDVLTENELQALAVILKNDDLKAFSDEHGVMIEVLVDGINEKAMDYIGDNLMDDDFVLYNDYKEQVKELIK